MKPLKHLFDECACFFDEYSEVAELCSEISN